MPHIDSANRRHFARVSSTVVINHEELPDTRCLPLQASSASTGTLCNTRLQAVLRMSYGRHGCPYDQERYWILFQLTVIPIKALLEWGAATVHRHALI